MGTGISGKYYTSRGSKLVHHSALIHSFEGKWKFKLKSQKLLLVTGGHGQSALNYMKKNGIEYNIEKVFPNGVRVGNIPSCVKTNKRKKLGMAWFPESWSIKDMVRAGEHIANLKHNRGVASGITIWGTWKGVRIGVIKTKGQIATIFPDRKFQPKPKRDEKHERI